MYTPNKYEEEPVEDRSEWHEPFPEPQTIPSGWDLSGLQPGFSSAIVVKAGTTVDD